MRSARHTILALLLAALAVASPLARADIYIVVNAANPVNTMTQKEVMDLYTGRSRAFPGGEPAMVFDHPRDSAARAALYQSLTGMSLVQVNSYWSRLTFTGQTLPPQPLPAEAVLADMVRRNPGAVGYLTAEPTDKALRVVFTLRVSANPS